MNAAETIQAAIDKLTRLRHMSDEDTFKLVGEGPALYLGYWYVASSADPSSITPEDADLIVTLYATIDAQIKVLEVGLQFSVITPNRYTDAAYELARAILGEQADD